MKARLSFGLILVFVLIAAVPGQAQGPEPQMVLGTPFTYQGVLRSSGNPVSGTCDFQFSLWDSASLGAQIGPAWPQMGVTVTRGLFTALLDFGAAPFQGANRYLEIAVRCPAGSGAYATLTPRQPLTPAPYALYAAAAHWTSLLGIPAGFADNVDDDTKYTAGTGLTLVGTQFNVNFAGTGSAGTVARSDHEHDARYWKVNGNSGLTPGINFLGTTDNTVLELKVNNLRALRLEPTSISPNVIAGYPGNNVIAGGVGGTVGGGGASGYTNRVTDSYGTVSGGSNNQAGDGNVNIADATHATVGGGQNNTAGNTYATVGGGATNKSTNLGATVSGGQDNEASGHMSTVSGGFGNRAAGEKSAVGGGDSNSADGHTSVVAGGSGNAASAQGSAVGGGSSNTASHLYATVPGGRGNIASARYTFAAGRRAKADDPGAFVWADETDADFASTAQNQFAVRASGGVWFTSALGDMLRMLPHSTAPNIIGGYQENTISAGVAGATIAGGGISTGINRVTDQHGTIGGGAGNVAGNDSGTTVDTSYATISGGWRNTASGSYSSIGGGWGNTASGSLSAIGGGDGNTAGSPFSTVGGGYENQATGERSTVAGGRGNIASAYSATVGGGQGNTADATRTTISGGDSNTASGAYVTIGGGSQSFAQGQYATISGGYTNTISMSGIAATIGGGQGNQASQMYATVGGGYYNTAIGNRATVPGGHQNTAQGDYSFAAGRRAKANFPGCFVWGDSTDADITCANHNRWMARASGGVYFYTNSTLTSGVYVASGGSGWSSVSDRAMKENLAPVDGADILARLAQIPLATWNYKSQNASIRHIGPVAQDFYSAFGVGEDERYINSVDADGVALAALQGAYHLLQERDAQIAAQQARIDDLETRLSALESLVAQLAQSQQGGGR